ncbi:MAG: CHAD domain-containing protein [Planctomycetota bacterium]|nr:CHAD domain-containing protein [Planctomycetota bacterium]
MTRKSKWIEIDSPDEPAVAVASRTLGTRLRLIWSYLKLIRKSSGEQVERVHQLRVSTRRAIAAVDSFAAVLPPKPVQWFAKQLKSIRKSANDARDLDVMMQKVREWPDNQCRTAKAELLKQLNDQRHVAQRPMDKIHHRLKKKHFNRHIRKLIGHSSNTWSATSHITFGELAATRLHALLTQFGESGRADLHSIDMLHRFRVHGKQLRYAMEVFAGTYTAEFRSELYPVLVDIQQRLGDINDAAGATAYFQQMQANLVDSEQKLLLQQMHYEEQKNLTRLHQEFLIWWNDDRRCDFSSRLAVQLSLTKAG